MTSWLRPGAWLLIVLVGSVVYSAATLMVLRRQQRALAHTEQQQDKMLRRVDAMLCAWAEHGDWNPILKDKLVRIVRGEDDDGRPGPD